MDGYYDEPEPELELESESEPEPEPEPEEEWFPDSDDNEPDAIANDGLDGDEEDNW